MRVFLCEEEDPRPYLASRGIRYEEEVSTVVARMIADVRKRGDLALLESARQFDAPTLTSLYATAQEIDEAMPPVEQSFAIDHAIERVKSFHERQLAAMVAGWMEEEFQSSDERRREGQPRHHVSNHRWTWNMAPEGSRLGQRMSPLARVGVYVPGGNATYPSSVVMNVVPAQVAGVNHVAVSTPARKDGTLAPSVLYAARYCGVAKILKVGGAAAIAGMALGTETLSRVDKVVGPGNRYVNEAKRQLWGSVGLDGYAGPSEVCVLIDDSSNPRFAAADFLTQIEHASDNSGYLVSTSQHAARRVMEEIELQLTGASREATMREAMAALGAVFVARDRHEACELVDLIAPEHLSLAVEYPDAWLGQIRNAGCIMIGEWTPESAGDYAAGPSHTLPTATAARFASPVSVLDFVKIQSLVQMSEAEFGAIAETIEVFGAMEGFHAHAQGAKIRIDEGLS